MAQGHGTATGRTARRPVLAALSAFLAALPLLLPGCAKDPAAPAEPEPVEDEDGFHADPEPEAKDFKFVVTAPESTVPLGGDLVFKVRVENHGALAARVNVPRLGRDSVVFKVRGDTLDIAWLDPIPWKFTNRGLEPNPAEVREIGKGESAEAEIRVAAVLCGKFVFTPLYSCQALGTLLTTDPVKIEVVPAPAGGAGAGGSHLGVRLETSHGTIDAKLRPDIAFQTSTSFATLVKKGFYDGLMFHRIVQGFMAQGGDPETRNAGDWANKGWGGPGYTLRRELHGKLPHRRGVFSMARQPAPETAGSQFFIMFSERPDLDIGGYTTFGEMIAGEDALKRLESVGAPMAVNAADSPREPVTIKKATILILP